MRCILSQKEIDIKWLGNVSRLYLYLTTSSSHMDMRWFFRCSDFIPFGRVTLDNIHKQYIKKWGFLNHLDIPIPIFTFYAMHISRRTNRNKSLIKWSHCPRMISPNSDEVDIFSVCVCVCRIVDNELYRQWLNRKTELEIVKISDVISNFSAGGTEKKDKMIKYEIEKLVRLLKTI